MSPEQFISQIQNVQGPLRRFLCVLCRGDADKADDIAQDTFMKAFLAIDSFKEQSGLNTWIFKIGYNCFVDKTRKEARLRVEGISSRSICVPSDERTDDRFKYEALYSAIDILSDREKAVILLFYKEGLSIKDIATVTGMSEANVKVSLFRGRNHIKEQLENGNR